MLAAWLQRANGHEDAGYKDVLERTAGILSGSYVRLVEIVYERRHELRRSGRDR